MELCFTLCVEKNVFGRDIEITNYLNDLNISYDLSGIDDAIYIDYIDNDINTISKTLCEILMDSYIKNYILKSIDLEYFYFNKDEQMKIVDEVCKNLNRGKLYDLLNKFISSNSHMNLCGFATFKMKNYYSLVDNEIEIIVDNYVIDKEYNEFIKLLKFFVDMQDAKAELVNIYMEDNFNYVMLDENGCIIDFDESKVSNEIASLDIDENEVLLSTLISIAPKKIIIHDHKTKIQDEIINTILKVFEQRVEICYYCEMKDTKKLMDYAKKE